MSAMWRDDITIRQAWDFLKTFSKRRGGAKPDLLEEEIITSPKETHEEKFLSKSPEMVEENDLIALKSVSLKENVKNAINSDQIDDIFGRKTENSAGKQIFGTKDNQNENETKTNPKEWEEYASSEGSYYSDDSSSSSDEWTFVDKAVDLKGDRREEEIKQSLYEKWSQNNDAAYDIENNLEEESRVEEENVQRTKVNATAIEKILRRELEEPKKESQEKSSEERMKCKRCTYLFDTKEENCGICGAAVGGLI